MTWPSRDQIKAMSRDGSCDAAHCIKALSPALMSALDGARLIFVDSGGKNQMISPVMTQKRTYMGGMATIAQ